ncbi:MAG: hypothetical protein AB7O31_07865 [Burkholderiales bacterium]
MNGAALETARAAKLLVVDHFRVRHGETVVVTVDSVSDRALVEAVLAASAAAGAHALLLRAPRLPYQGKLADPYVPDALAAAVAESDVWFDLTFPYLAGSGAHDRAMRRSRTRYLLLGDASAESLQRLYATVDADALFAVQSAFDDVMASGEGAPARVSAGNGSDFEFRLGRPGGRKSRVIDQPGSATVAGSCIYYPEPGSVRGIVALDAIFHEYYTQTSKPIVLHVDGEIRRIEHDPVHERVTERALRRATGGGYGRIIHLTCGFHPGARYTGQSFIEDIRTVGANAIGLGVPWWEPGGGENHPDGIVFRQSLWIDGEAIVADGRIVGPSSLAAAAQALEATVA